MYAARTSRVSVVLSRDRHDQELRDGAEPADREDDMDGQGGLADCGGRGSVSLKSFESG